jgi:hypothetical protein
MAAPWKADIHPPSHGVDLDLPKIGNTVKQLGDVLSETGTDRRLSFGMKRCRWR